MKNNKLSLIIIIALIKVAVVSAFFLVVKITPLFVTAYLITLFAIALRCFGMMYLLKSIKSYPWFASFPMTTKIYFSLQLTLSVPFIIRENIFNLSFPINWFALFHIVLLGFFLILLVVQKGGKDIIERVEEKVQEKYIALRSLQSDVEAIKERVPEQAKEIQTVVDALRYSMPKSHESVAPYEDKIKDSVIMLEQAAEQNNSEKISELCVTLIRQIKDRNNKAKLIK